MEKNHSILAVVIAAYFLSYCCSDVSSELSSSSEVYNNPLEQQCTWLFRSNPDDCKTYYQCLHGRSVLRRCPRQLHWNPDGHYCQHESKSSCKAGKRSGSSSVNSVLEVYDNTKALLKKRQKTSSCTANKFTPYPGDCSKFYHCDGNTQHVMDCPGGLHFQVTTGNCNWPSEAKCTQESVPSVTITDYGTTTERPIEITTSSTLPPFFPTSVPTTQSTTTFQPTVSTTELTTSTTYFTTSTTERPTTSSPTKYPILVPNSDYKVVCYFTNWAVYRREEGKYTPADIDPSKCTHIIYAFACLSPVTYTLEMCDSWIDGKEGKNFYGQITSLRSTGVKVMIAVGGWNDSESPKWPTVLKDPLKLEGFITSVCEFLKKYDFDGLDLDYEYPACPQANCNFDSKFEKQAFVALIKGLRLRCGPQTLLSAAVSCNENIMKEAYDVPTLSKYLDFINMMAYDFHGSWEKKTGGNSPFQAFGGDPPHLSVRHAVEVMIASGAPANKLCLGIPMYGQSFTLSNPIGDHDFGAKASGPGRAGKCTGQKGMLSYYEICNQTWTNTVHDTDNRVGPYRYDMNDGTWVSHDDPRHIKRKCDYIKKLGLGGAMIWALDLDDFRGSCGEGKYPLLSAINRNLRNASIQSPTSSKKNTNKSRSKSNKHSSSGRVSSSNSRSTRRRKISSRS